MTSSTSLDRVHQLAIELAERCDVEHGFRRARDLAGDFALWHGKRLGAAHAGVFLMAYLGALDALDVERRDRRATFSAVAREWWSEHDMTAAPYGAPWSPAPRA